MKNTLYIDQNISSPAHLGDRQGSRPLRTFIGEREIIFFITLKNKVCHLWIRSREIIFFITL
jgi:hypothetical protein